MLKAKNNFKDEKPLEGLEPFVADFCNDRITEVNYLIIQLQQKKFTEITSLSHKWKGFSTPYGFNYLETLATELHSKSQSKDYISCKNLIEQTQQYLEKKKIIIGDNFEARQGY